MFLKNLYEAGQSVVDPKCEVTLKCQKSSIDNFKIQSLSDTFCDFSLPPLNGLSSAPVLKILIVPVLKQKILPPFLYSRGSCFSPGINMITYKVYKKCPWIALFLFKIFQSILKVTTVPIHWRVASEVYIPKIKPHNPQSIEFQPIALLSVEGKLFLSLLSKRLEDHIMKNNDLIDLSVQKRCMTKVPGCCERMSLVWKELKAIKASKLGLLLFG